MATEQQPEGLDPTLPDNLDQDKLGAAGAARRRFAKAGLGASGVLMTLASQPGMATELVCRAPSGYLSGKLTSQKIDNLHCEGRSPGYWKNCSASKWPGGYSKSTRFKDVFTVSGGRIPNAYKFTKDTCTLGLLLDPQQWDTNKVAFHIIAAFLNASCYPVKTSFLTPNDVRRIWQEYFQYGVYKVNATVSWDGYQIVEYLKKTQL